MKKLVVPFDKENTKLVLIICPFLIFTLLFLFRLSNGLYYLLGYYIGLLVQFILVSLVLMFCVGLIFAIKLMGDERPAAILDENGIELKDFGFINWGGVKEFDIYRTPGTPVEVIGIRVNNIQKLFKQATLSGKMAIFWSKLFGYPPIFLSNITLENEAVINFAKQFMRE